MDYQLQKTRITSLEMQKDQLHAPWLEAPEKYTAQMSTCL
jgi:hypothetical protein